MRHRYYGDPTFTAALLFFAASLPALVIILGTLVRDAKSAPITRNGQFCSIGTYTQSDYCVTAQ